jgi:hypothetical protein
VQCPRERQSTTAPPTPPPPLAQADCQQDSILIAVPLPTDPPTYDTVTAADLPLIQRIANLPEFHDCQRFVVPPPGATNASPAEYSFGPLVAIWAADSLGGRFGVPGTEGPSLAVPVALIYNFEAGVAYDPLKIEPGFSCLYLWHNGGTPRIWNAAIVSLGPSVDPCQKGAEPRSLRGARLEVHPTSLPPGLDPADIPEVARWDWDPRRRQQYIGIRCADQWCEVGNAGLVPSQSLFERGDPRGELKNVTRPISGISEGRGRSNEVLRVVAIKGWYDEQQLDTLDSTGKPVLTNIVGTVIPHPALERAPQSTAGEWRPAAFIKVTADYPGAVLIRAGINRLELCQGSATACGAPAAVSCDPKYQDLAFPWWGRIISQAGDTSAVRCVRRRDHERRAIPAAAARWNWNEADAKTWVSCDEGCCTVN